MPSLCQWQISEQRIRNKMDNTIYVSGLVFIVGWLITQFVQKMIASLKRRSIAIVRDSNVPLNFEHSCDRELFTQLKAIVDSEVSSVIKLAPYNENARQLVELVGNRIFKEIVVSVGHERSESRSESQDASREAVRSGPKSPNQVPR